MLNAPLERALKHNKVYIYSIIRKFNCFVRTPVVKLQQLKFCINFRQKSNYQFLKSDWRNPDELKIVLKDFIDRGLLL